MNFFYCKYVSRHWREDREVPCIFCAMTTIKLRNNGFDRWRISSAFEKYDIPSLGSQLNKRIRCGSTHRHVIRWIFHFHIGNIECIEGMSVALAIAVVCEKARIAYDPDFDRDPPMGAISPLGRRWVIFCMCDLPGHDAGSDKNKYVELYGGWRFQSSKSSHCFQYEAQLSQQFWLAMDSRTTPPNMPRAQQVKDCRTPHHPWPHALMYTLFYMRLGHVGSCSVMSMFFA